MNQVQQEAAVAAVTPERPKASELARAWHANRRPSVLGRAFGRLAPSYALDPDVLAEITAAVVARGQGYTLPAEARRRAMYEDLMDRLEERWPGRLDRNPTWIVTRCGGAEMTLGILYGAPNEYLALCGTNLGISGADSGCYAYADVWDFILEGENYNAGASPFDPIEVTRPGEVTFLGRGDRKKWSLTGPGWMLDYARGVIPSMFWHGNIEAVASTANVHALRTLAAAIARGTVREVVGRVSGRFGTS